MSNALIELRDVGVCYRSRNLFGGTREFWALNKVSLTLNRGDTLGVIGRNGVGKSTLLKILADIIRPDRGTIETQDCRSTLLSLRVGFLNHLDARENAIMAGMLLGLSRKEIESKLDAILDFAELQEFVNVPIGTYSTGMVARLGFSIAMQIDPDILLIDEILAVGDENFRQKSSQALRQRMQSDKTVVLVAHNEQVIRQLCNQVVWIEDGQTMASGQADTVIDAYNSFLAEKQAVNAS
ncbi:MAG: ABC transporter ATP-binding protein [Proteobacteria bacterium]|nr:ABC transporter ATP-binding protein [Pseudomonadota bacterium]